jgi:hypothetical protein
LVGETGVVWEILGRVSCFLASAGELGIKGVSLIVVEPILHTQPSIVTEQTGWKLLVVSEQPRQDSFMGLVGLRDAASEKFTLF